MVILKINYEHQDIEKEVFPFFSNGIFLDTSILKIYFDGLIKVCLRKKQDGEYTSLINILNLLKLDDKWYKFYITPHILTETCRQIYSNYDKDNDYKEIVSLIFPILKDIKEWKEITKEKILSLINLEKPVLKMGDLSLFVSIDQFVNSYKKIAILVKDREVNQRYELHPNVMLIDFQKTSLDLLRR